MDNGRSLSVVFDGGLTMKEHTWGGEVIHFIVEDDSSAPAAEGDLV